MYLPFQVTFLKYSQDSNFISLKSNPLLLSTFYLWLHLTDGSSDTRLCCSLVTCQSIFFLTLPIIFKWYHTCTSILKCCIWGKVIRTSILHDTKVTPIGYRNNSVKIWVYVYWSMCPPCVSADLFMNITITHSLVESLGRKTQWDHLFSFHAKVKRVNINVD